MIYRVAHFSDFHLRRADKNLDRAIALIAHALGPDVGAEHVVVAGDIVDLASIRIVRRFVDGLKGLGLGGPSRVTVVPGNHDIFPASKRPPFVRISRPTSLWNRFCDATRFARRGRGCRQLLRGEPFPVGKVLSDDVVLAAVDSTRNQMTDPRDWCSGELVEEHIDAVGEFFDAHLDKKHRIVVMHHCVWEEESENARFPMIMADPDPVTATDWVNWAGASLVLCGHYHGLAGVQEAVLGDGSTLGLCAGTAGGVDEDDGMRAYHVVDLLENGKVEIAERAFDLEEVDEMI